MNHDQALGLYDAYFKGSLDRDTVRDFHGHLNGCEECKAHLRTLRASVAESSRMRPFSSPSEGKTLHETIWRNRVITYAVLAVLLCFVILLKLLKLRA